MADFMPDDDYVSRLIHIESGGNPRARTGSNRGLGQFGPNEELRYGLNEDNWQDRDAQINAIKNSAADNAKAFEMTFGRPPSNGELYLMHQQGVAGARALLSNPDEPAWKAIRPYYKSDAMAQRAVYGNIPDGNPLKAQGVDNVRASDFANMWTSRFGGPAPAVQVADSAPAAPAAAPTATADAASAPAPTPAPSGNPTQQLVAMLGQVGTDDRGQPRGVPDITHDTPMQLRRPQIAQPQINQQQLVQALMARLGNRGIA